MSYRFIKRIPLLAPLLTLVACSMPAPKPPAGLEAGDYQYVKHYMSWYINKQMKKQNVAGLSIALVDDQTIIWQQGFGYADKELGIPATQQTRYRAGSISKLFNAMATMKLVEAGKMDIDQPLKKYLPDFTIKSRFGNTDAITPRRIMTHHSGLPGDWVDGMWSMHPKSFTRRVEDIKNQYVAYPPDMLLSYSNLGVTLLGHAVQNVSGQAYADYLDQSLLQAMGMQHSRFEQGLSGDQASKSYFDGKAVIEYPLCDIPAGGLNTTVVDLARLGMMVNNHGKLGRQQILSASTLNEMLRAQNEDVKLDLGQKIGLAWFHYDNVLSGEEPVYGHDGGTIAHRASFMVAPRSKLAVVVLANSGAANSNEIGEKLLKMAWEAKFNKKLPVIQSAKRLQTSDLSGTYSTMFGKADIAKKSDNHYTVKLANENFDLLKREDGKFYLKYRLFGLFNIRLDELSDIGFYTDEINGEHVLIGEQSLSRLLAGNRIEPHTIHQAWKDRVGRYAIINQPEPESFQIKQLELKQEGEYLVVSITPLKRNSNNFSQQTIVLHTINDQEAIIEGLGRGMGETIQVEATENGNEILMYSGLRFKWVE